MKSTCLHILIYFIAGVSTAASLPPGDHALNSAKPNVIFILADDWGIGDVKCLGGETSKIETPHMDALAQQGMIFSDAHTSSSVCTPSRYSVLTGRYNWRSELKSGVLNGYSSNLIETNRPTVAKFMTENGYATACIGKWHLGMDMPTIDGKTPNRPRLSPDDSGKPLSSDVSNVNWKGTIKNGPNAVGFDYYWGISASLDMSPYIWIHNDKFVGECDVIKAFHLPGPDRAGPGQKDFRAEDVLPTITQKTVEFIQSNKDKPMFLYVPLNSPHTPLAPSKEWQGKSGLGPYGDFVMETDWAVGQIVKAVDDAGIADNTLIIVTADNGCSPAALSGGDNIAFKEGKSEPIDPEAHYASSIYRGHKADIFEGGHRVPFIARWNGKVKAGSTFDQPICLVDLYATCAEMLGKELTDEEAPDSVSFLPALLGTATGPLREATVHHSIRGNFAIRQGPWKLEMCPGSGGWSYPRPKRDNFDGLPPIQLYNLSKDIDETDNVYNQHPEVVKNLKALLTKYVEEGRSTPG
jgi:arylsulfatase A-like enzyme